MSDPFTILGISKDAYIDEIHSRYALLKKIWDSAKLSDPEMIQRAKTEIERIDSAYQELLDPKKRAIHQYSEDPAPKVADKTPVKTVMAEKQLEALEKTQQQPAIRTMPQRPEGGDSKLQHAWWVFLTIAIILLIMYGNTYSELLAVAKDRDIRIGRINNYVDLINELSDENEEMRAEIGSLKNMKPTEVAIATTSPDNNFCAESINFSEDVSFGLRGLVNDRYGIGDSYAIEESIYINGSPEKIQISIKNYTNNYVEYFFYYSDLVKNDLTLPSNVFWSSQGCWLK